MYMYGNTYESFKWSRMNFKKHQKLLAYHVLLLIKRLKYKPMYFRSIEKAREEAWKSPS